MPVITKIKQQKDKNRVNIYLDDKFGFGIDLENFVKLNLKVGSEYSEKEIEEIIGRAEFAKTYEKLIKFAMVRPRSAKEINDWLSRKKVHSSLFKKLFNRLKRLELVDDIKFAKWWIDQRNTFRPRSEKQLYSELLKKGIDRKLIKKTLEDVSVDEDKIALDLLKKRESRWKRFEKDKTQQKMYEYLARKGFSWEVIKKAVEKYQRKT